MFRSRTSHHPVLGGSRNVIFDIGRFQRDGAGLFRYRKPMQSIFLVFLGAGFGGTLRHGVNMAAMRYGAAGFPWGTLCINVAGSFVMGTFAAWFSGSEAPQPLRLFLMTGVLGGFTTFSAFSLETIVLWERGQAADAALYVVGSVGLSLAGLVAGLSLVRSLT
ncbi:MAG: protein CrcB [Hyphomicrobiales bacterium]|nr:protein CrcB [Hyphomicrobiales bacterium]